MEKGLKFKILVLDPDHAPFKGTLSLVRWDLPGSISTQNLKSLASPVLDLRKGDLN